MQCFGRVWHSILCCFGLTEGSKRHQLSSSRVAFVSESEALQLANQSLLPKHWSTAKRTTFHQRGAEQELLPLPQPAEPQQGGGLCGEGNTSRNVGLGLGRSLLLSLPLVPRLTGYVMGPSFPPLILCLIYLREKFLKAESAFNMRLCDSASKGDQFQMEPTCCYTNNYEWSQLKVMQGKTCIPGGKLQLRSLLCFKATVCLIVHTAARSCKWDSWSNSNSLPTGSQSPAATHSSCWDHHSLVTRHLNTHLKEPNGFPVLLCSLQSRHSWMACSCRSRTRLLV